MSPFLNSIRLLSTGLLLDGKVIVHQEKATLWFSLIGTPQKKYDLEKLVNFFKSSNEQVMVKAEDEEALEYARGIIFSRVCFYSYTHT